MNGLAVMLCVSLLGVQQTWRTTQEGQLEYVLQVEPTFLASLEQGESITSNLPASAKEVHRLCLRFSAGDLKRVKQRTPELPPLATAQERAAQAEPDIPVALVVDAQGRSEEITDVSHGWLAGKDGRVQYLVQLSPELLGKLQDGDEIYMNVYPEAGQVQEFIVLAGKEILPRKAAKTHPRATLTAKDRKTVAPAGAESPTVYGPVASETPAFSPRNRGPYAAGAPIVETRGYEPRVNEPGRLRNPPQYAVGDEPAEQPVEQPIYGPAENGGPAAAPELFATNPAEENVQEEPAEQPLYGATINPPRTTPPRAAPAEAPVFDRSQFDQSQFANAPINKPRMTPVSATKKTHASLTPPEDGNQYLQESELRHSKPQSSFGAADNNIATTAGAEERTDIDNSRTASVEPTKRRSSLSAGSTKSTKSTTASADDETPKPYWPLFFTCCALFLSVGGNLYLGWTAAEFYSRYRKTIERMRGGSREGDND